MIVRVPSDQLVAIWDFVKPAVLNGSLRKGDEEFASFMLKKFLASKVDLWIVYTEEQKPVGIFTTAYIQDSWGVVKMIILSLYGMGITDELYAQSFGELKRVAKSKGCAEIVASTDSQRLVDIARTLGAEFRTEVCFKL